MSLTPVGAGVILFAISSCLLWPRRLSQSIIFFSSFSATAVFNFRSYGMAPAAILFPAYVTWQVFSGEAWTSAPISRNHLLIVVALIAFTMLSIASLLLNAAVQPVVLFQLTQTAYVVFGLIMTLVLSCDYVRPGRLEAIIGALRAGACFIALWGIVQAVCFYTHVPYPLLFNNSTSHFADMFDQQAGPGLLRVASVATEPSFVAVSLLIFGSFGTTLLVIEKRFRYSGWTVPVFLVLAIVIASTSTTGYLGLVVLALVIGLYRPIAAIGISCLIVLGLAVVFVTVSGFRDVFYQVTIDKAQTGSYDDRMASVWDAFPVIAAQPWLGWGWGKMTSLSILTQIPLSVGSIGSAVFLAAVLLTIYGSRAARLQSTNPDAWRLRAYARGTENAMLVYLAQSAIAGFHFVVADFWCLWALAIAIPSCLVCSEATNVSRLDPDATSPHATMRSARPKPIWAGHENVFTE